MVRPGKHSTSDEGEICRKSRETSEKLALKPVKESKILHISTWFSFYFFRKNNLEPSKDFQGHIFLRFAFGARLSQYNTNQMLTLGSVSLTEVEDYALFFHNKNNFSSMVIVQFKSEHNCVKTPEHCSCLVYIMEKLS